MSDVNRAYNQITNFLNNEIEKTLLICGVADKEKHLVLLKALNAKKNCKGLVYLIHTTRDGMMCFFHWAGLYEAKVPKRYGERMKLSNITIFFDKLSTKNNRKYDNSSFDFMIIWPIQSVTKNEEEIIMLKEMIKRQKTKKIILLTIMEPWYSPEPLKYIADKIVKLDCEHDDTKEYKRIMSAYKEEMRIHKYKKI